MRARGFTHVSVGARDLDESARFYRELFGLEEVPHPDFPFPVRWLRVGDLQLHLFESGEDGPRAHHFALDVDDFGAVHDEARRRGALVESGSFAGVRVLPCGALQAYLRDPSGNLVEINHPLPDPSALERVGEARRFGGEPGTALYMEPDRKAKERS